MIALKVLLTVAGALMLAAAIAIPLYGLWLRVKAARKKANESEKLSEPTAGPEPIAWNHSVALAIGGCVPLILATGIVVVPSGMGGVRVSQLSGTLPGTLYPGAHFITPLVDNVEIFDLRDHLFTAGVLDEGVHKAGAKPAVLTVQSMEGLNIGLGITVRYRLDPNKLATVQPHLPQPADKQLVPPVVASAWRQLAPQYTVREIFSTKREEVRAKAAGIITRKLASEQGEVTASLLPQSLSGYAFLFPVDRDLNKANELRGGLNLSPLTLQTDGDGAMQLTAQRLALNLREAGFNVQMAAANAQHADLALTKLPIAGSDPPGALASLLLAAGQTPSVTARDPEALFRIEHDFLDLHTIVPLLDLPRAYAIGGRVRDFQLRADGTPDLASASVPASAMMEAAP